MFGHMHWLLVCHVCRQELLLHLQVTRPAGVVSPALPAAALVCSVIMGITTSLILFCSHFHQIDDDKAANKMSPLVRLGTANGVKVRRYPPRPPPCPAPQSFRAEAYVGRRLLWHMQLARLAESFVCLVKHAGSFDPTYVRGYIGMRSVLALHKTLQ